VKLIDQHCSDEVRSKLKEDDLLNFYKCLPKDKYLNLQQKAVVYATLFRSTYICEQAFSLMKLNKGLADRQKSYVNPSTYHKHHTSLAVLDICIAG
jgi:hypothetical protein